MTFPKLIDWFLFYFLFFGWGGFWKFLLEKGGGLRQNGGGEGGVSRNWGCILRFCWKFLMMQHRKKKSWCVYLFFGIKHVLQNNCLGKIWDEWTAIELIVLIIIIAVIIIHAKNKYSAWYFYLSYNVNKHVL